jgi:hypothetical protein
MRPARAAAAGKARRRDVVFNTADLVTDLPRLLDRHREDVAVAWSAAVRSLPSPRYAAQTDAALRDVIRRGLAAMSQTIASASHASLDEYLAELSATWYEQGFDTGEVVEGLLLWREATIRAVKRAYPNDSQASYAAVGELDPYLRYLISRFSQLYSVAINRDLREQKQQATAMLAENARLYEETRRRLANTLSLQRITNAILERQPLAAVLRLVCHEAITQLQADEAILFVLDEAGEFSEAACSGDGGSVRADACLDQLRRVVEENRPLLLCWDERTGGDAVGVLAVPLQARQSVIGALVVRGRRDSLGEDGTRLAQMLGDQAAMAIENMRLREQADRLAVIE